MESGCAVESFFNFLRISPVATLRRSEGRRLDVVQFDWRPLVPFVPLPDDPDEGNISTTAPTNFRDPLLTTLTASFSQYVRHTQKNEIDIRAFSLHVLIKLVVAPEILAFDTDLKIAFAFRVLTVLVLRRHAPD